MSKQSKHNMSKEQVLLVLLGIGTRRPWQEEKLRQI